MSMVDIIERKRNKEELSPEEIHYFIKGYVEGNIPDYQVSSLLMAIYLNGMTSKEISSLTDEMTHSGSVWDLSDIEGSHLSPTEAFAASTISLLIDWPGVEYVYPKEIIFRDGDGIVADILDTYSDSNKYSKMAEKLKDYCSEEFGEKYFVEGLKDIFSYDLNNEVKTVISFKNPDFKNAVLINDESEISDAIDKNDGKISLMISKDIDDNRIKNIYWEFASKNVRIYSQNFFDNLDKAYEFIDLCNEIHKSNVSLS